MKKITKILCLGIIFLFVISLQVSAQKCKYDYNKTDPFTGEATKGNIVGINFFFGQMIEKMEFNKVGETYFLSMNIGSIVYEKEFSGKIGKNISNAAACILK